MSSQGEASPKPEDRRPSFAHPELGGADDAAVLGKGVVLHDNTHAHWLMVSHSKAWL